MALVLPSTARTQLVVIVVPDKTPLQRVTVSQSVVVLVQFTAKLMLFPVDGSAPWTWPSTWKTSEDVAHGNAVVSPFTYVPTNWPLGPTLVIVNTEFPAFFHWLAVSTVDKSDFSPAA